MGVRLTPCGAAVSMNLFHSHNLGINPLTSRAVLVGHIWSGVLRGQPKENNNYVFVEAPH